MGKISGSRNIITRSEARSLGLKRYFTGKPCKNSHIDQRIVSNKSCVKCVNERNERRRISHPHEARARTRRWKLSNKSKIAATNAARRAAKNKRTPPWLTRQQREEMKRIYIESQVLTEWTGVPHHVDHIVPLKGRNVSGLHVPWNLQILTAQENLAKQNTHKV